jgi:hypothetical protein
MNPTIAGALIASVATVVSFVLGALTSILATRVATNRAQRERAQVTYSEVVAGMTRAQVAVEDYHARRTSVRARRLMAAEVTFNVGAAILTSDSGKRIGNAIPALAAGFQRVNDWDRDESDRVATLLDRSLGQFHPAMFLLALMDRDLIVPTKAIGEALRAYSEATGEGVRRTKSEELTASVNDLGGALRVVIEARWSHVLPRRRKPSPTADNRPSKPVQ